jgi:hypothetical protein
MTQADEHHLRRAVELAAAARAAGDMPFGSLLVPTGDVLAEERNTVATKHDIAAHPSSSWLAGSLGSSTRRWRGRPRCTRAASPAPCAGVRSRALGLGASSSRSPASNCRSSGRPEPSVPTRRTSRTRGPRCSPRLAFRSTATTTESRGARLGEPPKSRLTSVLGDHAIAGFCAGSATAPSSSRPAPSRRPRRSPSRGHVVEPGAPPVSRLARLGVRRSASRGFS